ncbi:hypothetical protein Q3G72_002743 [Acer saccharum]|nr:hypothetical protein Q3G72_002743 [Acer saccharum]
MQQWLSSKSMGESDQPGCSLFKKERGIIHMIAGLGFEWALNPILSHRVSVNFWDINGLAALHWASRFGRKKMVAALLASGAFAGAWRRKGVGLRGFRQETESSIDDSEDEDILKVFRKEKVDGAIDEAVSRVYALQQYRRMLERYWQAKAELGATAAVEGGMSQLTSPKASLPDLQ